MDESFDAVEKLAELLRSDTPSLEHSLLLLSECLQQRRGIVSSASDILDTLATDIDTQTSGPPDIDDLVEGLFGRAGFAGDVTNYHGEDNSLLDRVLDRRLGMPITLSAVVAAVGDRIGLTLELLGLPGHVVVGIPNHDDAFVDAYAGSLVDRAALEVRLRSIFGRDVAVDKQALTPMRTTAVVSRVCNNLMRTWANEPVKFDHLLEVRSRLPTERNESIMLTEIAEARSRFDIAARLRETLDPTDPEIDALWGKLN